MFNRGSLSQVLQMARASGAQNIMGLMQNQQQMQAFAQQFGQQFGNPEQLSQELIQSGQIPGGMVDQAVQIMKGMGIHYDPRQQQKKPFQF